MTDPRPRPRVPALVRAMRPHQWTKNVLVFAAPVAAGRITEGPVLRDTLIAFVAFCLASSGTYLLNDARDVDADRRHPTKRFRPIAAGELSVQTAVIVAGLVLVASLLLSTLASRDLVITVLAYLVLTAAYNLRLKDEAVLDIVCVATGFVLRAIAGATATGLPLSEWFFIVTCFGALLMVTGKREAEAKALGADAAAIRPSLARYSPAFLLLLRGVATAVVLVGYCLWAFDGASTATTGAGTGLWFQLSILPFAVAILRYALLVDQGEGAEPERLVLHDHVLLGAGVCWAIIYGYGVYVA